jgi:hypothetical protein
MSPYVANLFRGMLALSVIFVCITTVVLLYHWWRYSDSKIMTLVTVLSYVVVSAILLFIMYGSLT